MCGEVGCLGIVEKGVKRCENGTGEKIGERQVIWMVKARIYDESEICREQDSGGEDNKRVGSVLISMHSTSWETSNRTCERNGAIAGGWEQGDRREM